MKSQIQSIPIEDLVPHPDHPNRMSQRKFAKLIHNIERTGLYEPLVVRYCPVTHCQSFQIINGHYRWKALLQLGYKTVEAVVWEIGDVETDILLATLNRLGGSDVLQKKLSLMARLNQRAPAPELSKLLPHTAQQIHRMAQMRSDRVPRIKPVKSTFAHPVVFFLSNAQKEILEKALSCVQQSQSNKTRAAKNAAALTTIARQFNMKS